MRRLWLAFDHLLPAPILVATLAASLTLPARGQLTPCSEVNTVTGYKVLLDDIKLGGTATGADDQRVMRLLNFHLKNRLDSLDEEGPGWKILRCQNRFPEDTNVFSADLVTGLVRRDVVLEIWGEIGKSNGLAEVFVYYALLPVPPASVTPFLQRRYQPKSISSPDDLMEWLSSINELSGYALATRALRLVAIRGAQGYDQAKHDLETSIGMLAEAFGANPDPSQKRLLGFHSQEQVRNIAEGPDRSGLLGPSQANSRGPSVQGM